MIALPCVRLPARMLLVLIAISGILVPVLADTGAISIAYRGPGSGYVGDTVVFDGKNTYGNTTLIRITGPGLPAEGVPAANLNGPAGTGTPVHGDPDGTWKYTWYSASVPGNEKLQTWRYTFIAADSDQPDKTATSRFQLKRPVFRIAAVPNPVTYGNYVELIGTAETGGDSAKIDIGDSSGRILHTYTSPVSATGSFSYSFHVDMPPGQYRIIVNTPLHKDPFGTTLTVAEETGVQPSASTPGTSGTGTAPPSAGNTGGSEPVPAVPTRTPQSPVAVVTIPAALIAGMLMTALHRR